MQGAGGMQAHGSVTAPGASLLGATLREWVGGGWFTPASLAGTVQSLGSQ